MDTIIKGHKLTDAEKQGLEWVTDGLIDPSAHEPPPQPAAASTKKPQPQPPRPGSGKSRLLSQKEFTKLLSRARKLAAKAESGDSSALDELRQLLEDEPIIFQTVGDIQRKSEHALIQALFPDKLLERESFRRRLSAVRSQCNRPNDSVMTQLAASRVVMCWCLTQFYEYRAVQEMGDRQLGNLLVQAEKRYQLAMKTYELAVQLDIQRAKAAANGSFS